LKLVDYKTLNKILCEIYSIAVNNTK